VKAKSARLQFRFLSYFFYILVFVLLAIVLRDPGQTWGWAMLGALTVAFGIHVHRSSQRWLEALGIEAHELTGQPIPWDLEQASGRLHGFGFGVPVLWTYGDRVVSMLISKDGSTVASVSSDDDGRGPVLTTVWKEARLSTSRGRSIPITPGEYAQNLPDLDLSELVDAHDEGVRLLSNAYGTPTRRTQLALKEATDAQRQRRETLLERRYRHTAKVLISWYRGRYNRRLDSQLKANAKPWHIGVDVASAVVLWLVAIAAWVAYFIDDSFEVGDWPLPLAMTLLFGAISLSSFKTLRERRRFTDS